MPQSPQDLFNTAQAQITALDALSAAIDTKVAAIKNASGPGGLSGAQRATIASLRAGQATIERAIQELAAVTIQALDNSAQITAAITGLQSVTGDLKTCSAQIGAIGDAAKNVSAIATQVSGLVSNLQTLVKGK